MTPDELPAYSDLILPTVRAVITLGGSATAREITSQVVADLAPSDDMLAVTQENRPDASVLMERISWARSYAKLIGALESPKRGVFLVTALGKELAGLPPRKVSGALLPWIGNTAVTGRSRARQSPRPSQSTPKRWRPRRKRKHSSAPRRLAPSRSGGKTSY